MIKLKTKIIYAEEFEDDAYLDVLSLGKEVFLQPTLYEKYSRYMTNLEDERDGVQAALDYKTDMMSLSIREDPDSYELGKLTEGAIKAIININEDVMELKKDLQYVNKLVKEAKGALYSIDRKGRSLDNATKMYVTGYWGQLTAVPQKMQDDIDAYLDKKDLTAALESNKRMKNMRKEVIQESDNNKRTTIKLRRSKNGQKEIPF